VLTRGQPCSKALHCGGFVKHTAALCTQCDVRFRSTRQLVGGSGHRTRVTRGDLRSCRWAAKVVDQGSSWTIGQYNEAEWISGDFIPVVSLPHVRRHAYSVANRIRRSVVGGAAAAARVRGTAEAGGRQNGPGETGPHEPAKRRVALKIIKPGMDTRQVIARFPRSLTSAWPKPRVDG